MSKIHSSFILSAVSASLALNANLTNVNTIRAPHDITKEKSQIALFEHARLSKAELPNVREERFSSSLFFVTTDE